LPFGNNDLDTYLDPHLEAIELVEKEEKEKAKQSFINDFEAIKGKGIKGSIDDKEILFNFSYSCDKL